MAADMSFFHLIAGASLVVKLVMLLLLVAIYIVWTARGNRRAAHASPVVPGRAVRRAGHPHGTSHPHRPAPGGRR